MPFPISCPPTQAHLSLPKKQKERKRKSLVRIVLVLLHRKIIKNHSEFLPLATQSWLAGGPLEIFWVHKSRFKNRSTNNFKMPAFIDRNDPQLLSMAQNKSKYLNISWRRPLTFFWTPHLWYWFPFSEILPTEKSAYWPECSHGKLMVPKLDWHMGG